MKREKIWSWEVGHLLHKKGKKKGGDQTLTLAPPPPLRTAEAAANPTRSASSSTSPPSLKSRHLPLAAPSQSNFPSARRFRLSFFRQTPPIVKPRRSPLPPSHRRAHRLPQSSNLELNACRPATIVDPRTRPEQSGLAFDPELNHVPTFSSSREADPTRALLREPIASRANAYSVGESHARRAFQAALHAQAACRAILHARAALGHHCWESVTLRLGLVEQISRITTYLRLRSPTGPPVWHCYRHDSSDLTGSSQPDCLSISPGYATNQFLLGVPLGHRRPDFVPTGSHVAHVRECASS
ncbi:hypothetical protein E5676_scaffold120G001170 [Cucumis melo var. makuwa]|uniref:Uncharacterized protein n=1 Tax=Cucumis melo var. makuwa TaxID=1194695 RepID=A0A5D3E0H2_CUCMM|nr:hypothetical protein E5676_scaffold120G001170 [Cucumis melo var. makuwa]